MPDICRLCGDRFAVWFGAPMADGLCPLTRARSHCPEVLARSRFQAQQIKACPQGFDEAGEMRPACWKMVADAMIAAGLDPLTGTAAPGAKP